MVWKAYQLVNRNGKASGVDVQSLDDFAKDLENKLYKLWSRMAFGSYFPPPVRRVEIPKSGGGSRPLGIPTVGDRVAHMVVKQVLEPQLEPIFDQVFMATDRASRPTRPWRAAASAAASMIGQRISKSRGFQFYRSRPWRPWERRFASNISKSSSISSALRSRSLK